MSDIDTLLRRYYSHQSLSEEKVADIKAATAKSVITRVKPDSNLHKANKSSKSNTSNAWRYGAVALLFITLGMSSMAVYKESVRVSKQEVLNELVLSHKKPFHADYDMANTDFSELNATLSEVKFAINIPDKIRNGFTLLAAHYCSIAEQFTVHLQLVRNDDNKMSSLFITSASPLLRDIESDTPWTMREGDQYWSDQSTFYALLNSD